MKNNILSWYVLHTKSRFENVVHEGLIKKSIDTFLPKISKRSKRKDRKIVYKAPLFPGYLFVKTKLNSAAHIEILKTTGAVRLIGNKSGPLTVPDSSIASIKIMVDTREIIKTGTRFKKGDRVMVVDGPFAGIVGIFSRYRNGDRIIVFIDALGQFAAVDVNEEDVEKVMDNIST